MITLNRAMKLGVVMVSYDELHENAMDFVCEVRRNLDQKEKSHINGILHDLTDGSTSFLDTLKRYDDMFLPMFDQYLVKFKADMVAVLKGNGEIVPLWKLDQDMIGELNDIPLFKLHGVEIDFNWKSREGDTLAQCIMSGNKIRTIITLRNNITDCGLCESKTFDDNWLSLMDYAQQYCKRRH